MAHTIVTPAGPAGLPALWGMNRMAPPRNTEPSPRRVRDRAHSLTTTPMASVKAEQAQY